MIAKGSAGGGTTPLGWRRAGTATVVALLAALGWAGVPAARGAAPAPGWHAYVLGPPSPQVVPVGVESRGRVSHPRTLVTGGGKATALTTVAGETPASVLLNFGKDVAGTPYLDIT